MGETPIALVGNDPRCFCRQDGLFPGEGVLERKGLDAHAHLMVIVRIGAVDGVPEEDNELGSRHSCPQAAGGMGIEEIVGVASPTRGHGGAARRLGRTRGKWARYQPNPFEK